MTSTPNAKLRYPEENDNLTTTPYHTAMKNLADDIEAAVIRRGDIRTVAQLPASPTVGDTFLLTVPWANTMSEDNSEPNTPMLWPIVYNPQNGYRYSVLGGEELWFDGGGWFVSTMAAFGGNWVKVTGGSVTPRIKFPFPGRWLIGGGAKQEQPLANPAGAAYRRGRESVSGSERFLSQDGHPHEGHRAVAVRQARGRGRDERLHVPVDDERRRHVPCTITYVYMSAMPRQIIAV